MNENIDLTKILYGCPEGTKFYSTIYGDVCFIRISHLSIYPIELIGCTKTSGACTDVYTTKEGLDKHNFNGECTLFPSKDQRDWSKFERFWDKSHQDKPVVEKFDPKTFQPFDKVLARDYRDVWGACLFSHPGNNLSEGWFVCDNTYWHYIIPYNDDTKHLVGTKEDCPEYYKWWEE